MMLFPSCFMSATSETRLLICAEREATAFFVASSHPEPPPVIAEIVVEGVPPELSVSVAPKGFAFVASAVEYV